MWSKGNTNAKSCRINRSHARAVTDGVKGFRRLWARAGRWRPSTAAMSTRFEFRTGRGRLNESAPDGFGELVELFLKLVDFLELHVLL